MTLVDSAELRLALGIFSSLFGFIAYIPYFRDIFRGKTKPHAFTWLIFSVLTIIGFAAQIYDGAGAGAWITLVSAIACTLIFILSIKVGNWSYSRFDWLCLISSLAGIPLWILTETPLWSVILITGIDVIACLPTLRKAWNLPQEETPSSWLMNSLKFIPAVLALDNISVITALYPSCLILINFIIFLIIISRSRIVIRPI